MGRHRHPHQSFAKRQVSHGISPVCVMLQCGPRVRPQLFPKKIGVETTPLRLQSVSIKRAADSAHGCQRHGTLGRENVIVDREVETTEFSTVGRENFG